MTNPVPSKRLYNRLILFMLAIVGLDQLTKILVIQHIPFGTQVPLIPGVVHLTYLRNTGAAFSMLSGARWLFLVLVVVFLGTLWLLIRKGVLREPVELWCMAAIAGGAVGNAIDRALSGAVVDMIEVEFVRFAVFNVADSFITCGAIVFVIYILCTARNTTDKTEDTKEQDHADEL